MKVSLTATDEQLVQDSAAKAWLIKAEEKIQANLDALNNDLHTFGTCFYDGKTGERIHPLEVHSLGREAGQL